MRGAVWCMLLAACGTDVRLGSAPDARIDAPVDSQLDAPTDGPTNPFTSGTYGLAFFDPVQVMCDGDLIGMEANFESITRVTLSFVDGTVALSATDGTHLRVSGPPIGTGFGGGDLVMVPEPDPPPGEPVVWGASVSGNFGSGPLSTTNTDRFLGMDSSSANEPQISAYGAALFQNAGSSGACTVAFTATFASQ